MFFHSSLDNGQAGMVVKVLNVWPNMHTSESEGDISCVLMCTSSCISNCDSAWYVLAGNRVMGCQGSYFGGREHGMFL